MEKTSMKTFSEESKCAKCGHDKVSVEFKGKKTWVFVSITPRQQNFDFDVMLRTCDRCTYCWIEGPLS